VNEEIIDMTAKRQEVLTQLATAPITPMDMLNRAVESGAGIDVLEKLMSLQERWERNQGRKAFDNAIAEAKAELAGKPILKTKTVSFGGKGASYKHETLDGVLSVVTPILAKHGLSVRFRTSSTPNEPISVTCIISHREGHAEENTLQAGRDDSGAKNAIQGIGSTVSYLQRYTLKAALGLAAADDDDGKASGEDMTPITEEQLRELVALVEKVKADVPRLCKYLKIDSLELMPVSKFEAAKKALQAKEARS
jgi:hypothetical protein